MLVFYIPPYIWTVSRIPYCVKPCLFILATLVYINIFKFPPISIIYLSLYHESAPSVRLGDCADLFLSHRLKPDLCIGT